MEHFQKELAEVAIKKIVSSLRSILYRIETKECTDVIGLLEPYMDSESFQNIREIYLNYKNNQLKHVDDDNDDDDELYEENEDDENINSNNFINNIINQCNINNNNSNSNNSISQNENIDESIRNNISQKYLLQIQNVAARLVSPSNTAAAMDNGNREHSYNRISDKSRGDNGDAGNSSGARKKRRSKGSGGFPFNWNLIASMISNITLDQVESMIKVLIMVLSRTPVNVLLKQFHEYKFIISSVFDLLNAIIRRDIKDIGANLIIAIVGVIRFSQRKNLPLIFGMEVAKYLYNSGNKKKFSLVKSVSLIAFLSNLLKLVNPPPVTPLDIIQLVKSQIQSKL